MTAADLRDDRPGRSLDAQDLTLVGFKDAAWRKWRVGADHTVVVTLIQVGGQGYQTVRMADLQRVVYLNLDEDPRRETVAGLRVVSVHEGRGG